jgi:uncharacterized alkaline shock family protein YloU
MAMNQTTDGYLLPCGRDVETVWEHLPDVTAGRADAHELDCPYCRQTHESLRALRAATEELAADVAEPPLDLTDRIMSAVRADVRRHRMLPLPTSEPGDVRISEQAVAAVLRFAADSVLGVRARRCRVRVTADAGDEVALAVDLDVAIQHGFHADALAMVRQRVAAAATARIGLRLHRLDLAVVDLYDTGPDRGI